MNFHVLQHFVQPRLLQLCRLSDFLLNMKSKSVTAAPLADSAQWRSMCCWFKKGKHGVTHILLYDPPGPPEPMKAKKAAKFKLPKKAPAKKAKPNGKAPMKAKKAK